MGADIFLPFLFLQKSNTAKAPFGHTLSYNSEDHLLTAGTTAYQYDPDGFLTSRTDGADVTQFDYSSRGELLRTTLPYPTPESSNTAMILAAAESPRTG